jgi:hypothetical protein
MIKAQIKDRFYLNNKNCCREIIVGINPVRQGVIKMIVG